VDFIDDELAEAMHWLIIDLEGDNNLRYI
jgi:hypothetical protein